MPIVLMVCGNNESLFNLIPDVRWNLSAVGVCGRVLHRSLSIQGFLQGKSFAWFVCFAVEKAVGATRVSFHRATQPVRLEMICRGSKNFFKSALTTSCHSRIRRRTGRARNSVRAGLCIHPPCGGERTDLPYLDLDTLRTIAVSRSFQFGREGGCSMRYKCVFVRRISA